MKRRRLLGRLAHGTIRALRPHHRILVTREGFFYALGWSSLLAIGIYHQINLILLVAALAAGPMAASWRGSSTMLRRLRVTRRVPAYVFAGDPLRLDYALENPRRLTPSLAVGVEDALAPVDRMVSGSERLFPGVFFARVPSLGRERLRWQGPSPKRGKYQLDTVELVTRAPFGLLERRLSHSLPGDLIVYPAVGQLARRWHALQREAIETKRGHRHDRTAQQQEYHGLRDYRPGDSPRWIHWRTSARLATPMVKEFEQQNEQDLCVLIDPWLPRTKVTPEQRETLEEVVRFAATLCLDTCRSPGRRLLLGWTGASPGVRQGPATVKLLHELLEQLALMRPTSEGQLSSLFDMLPASTLYKAILVVVSTRPVNLVEEAERSARLSGASGRGLLGRITLLDASRGDLAGLVEYSESSLTLEPHRRVASGGIAGVERNEAEAGIDRRRPPAGDGEAEGRKSPEKPAARRGGWQ